MSETIKVKVFAPSMGQLESINEFFEKQGMGFKVSENDVLFLELKQMPSILAQIKTVGYFEEDESIEWPLVGISDKLVELWVLNYEGDGCIFIPLENVLAIHTIDEKWLRLVATDGANGHKKRETCLG